MAFIKHSEKVPKAMRAKFKTIVTFTDAFSETHLNDEYAQLARYAAAALCRKRPSPLLKGRETSWACGIIYALGVVNFLFSKEDTPYMTASELCNYFGVSTSTGSKKSKEVSDILKMTQLDPNWCLPSKMNDNPLAWMVMLDGYAVDARDLPRHMQELAYEQGAIPYIPEEQGKSLPFEAPKTAIALARKIISEAQQTTDTAERIRLAEEALSVCEECVEAYLILAEDKAENIEEARAYFEKAMAAGVSLLGDTFFKECAGNFWEYPQARGYMRARARLIHCLFIMKDEDLAVAHCYDMLKLNENDDQGIRYPLSQFLAISERYDELDNLLNIESGKDDMALEWLYLRAFLCFVKEGDTKKARKKLKTALKKNPIVADYVLGEADIMEDVSQGVVSNDKEEAMRAVGGLFIPIWHSVEYAVDWLEHNAYKNPKSLNNPK